MSICDIRNNNAPVSDSSNTIKNSDNKYSNELKSSIKKMIALGYNYDQVVFELDKIYGTGILTTNKYFENKYHKENYACYLFFYSFMAVNFGICYKLYKFIKRR